MQDMEKFVSEDHPREEKVKFAGPLGLLESLGFLIDEWSYKNIRKSGKC